MSRPWTHWSSARRRVADRSRQSFGMEVPPWRRLFVIVVVVVIVTVVVAHVGHRGRTRLLRKVHAAGLLFPAIVRVVDVVLEPDVVIVPPAAVDGGKLQVLKSENVRGSQRVNAATGRTARKPALVLNSRLHTVQ